MYIVNIKPPFPSSNCSTSLEFPSFSFLLLFVSRNCWKSIGPEAKELLFPASSCIQKHKNIDTRTCMDTHTHRYTHTWLCFITSCLLLELLSSLEWARQSRLYCVNLFVCQERLQRSLSLFVFGRGDGREGEWRRRERKKGGFAQEPFEPPELDGWPVTSLYSGG